MRVFEQNSTALPNLTLTQYCNKKINSLLHALVTTYHIMLTIHTHCTSKKGNGWCRKHSKGFIFVEFLFCIRQFLYFNNSQRLHMHPERADSAKTKCTSEHLYLTSQI